MEKEVIENNIQLYMEQKGMELPENWREKIHFKDQWLAGGYGCYDQEIQDIIADMYRQQGIALDPVYTGKAYRGMMEYLKEHDIRGKNILIHHQKISIH